jgi:hypothetical protein
LVFAFDQQYRYSGFMKKPVSSIDAILKALPAIQKSVRKEIQTRIDAGEDIAGIDSELDALLTREKAEFLTNSREPVSIRPKNGKSKRAAA